MAEPTLELIQTMLQQVLDNQRPLSLSIDELRLRIIAIEQRFTSIDTRLDAIQLQLSNFNERMNRVERRLGLIDVAP